MRPGRRRCLLGVVAAMLVGCSSAGGRPAAAVDTSGCAALRDLHDSMADRLNEATALERASAPSDRVDLIATALDDIVVLMASADPPEEPAQVFDHWSERRDDVVEEATTAIASYRREWTEIAEEERRAAIPEALLLLERWMSETEPAVPDDAAVVAGLRNDPACRHVLQLPPDR